MLYIYIVNIFIYLKFILNQMDLIENRPFFYTIWMDENGSEKQSQLTPISFFLCLFLFCFSHSSSKWRFCITGKRWYRWIGDLLMFCSNSNNISSVLKDNCVLTVLNCIPESLYPVSPEISTVSQRCITTTKIHKSNKIISFSTLVFFCRKVPLASLNKT